jgi:polysaccharide export outer membrane protein
MLIAELKNRSTTGLAASIAVLSQKPASFLIALLLLSAPLGKAQTSVPEVTPPYGPAASVPPSQILPAESLGADDLLEIMVSYCPELTHSFRVSSDGSLSLPLLHQKLKVDGLTPSQVGQLVRDALVKEGVLADPTVNVSVLEYRSRPVSVVGAVNHPLTFQATGNSTLLDAVAKAGGIAPDAGGSLIITNLNPSAEGTVKTARVIRLNDLLRGADPGLNVRLNGGEEIRVPEASKIFVAGNVRRPGMYPMLSDSDTTVVKAITLSEGLDTYSAPTAFIYRRHGSSADRDELKVPLNRIMAHKEPDIPLMADDILYIPGSDAKRLTSKILSQLAGFGQTAGAGVLIYK